MTSFYMSLSTLSTLSTTISVDNLWENPLFYYQNDCAIMLITLKEGDVIRVIHLCSGTNLDVTVVSNQFIDEFMPAANGSYVKVYLYLLRCLSTPNADISISMIADQLDDTEKDILRALTYWEKMKLISLAKNSVNDIIGIQLNDVSTIQDKPIESKPTVNTTTESKDQIAATVTTPQRIPTYTPEILNQLAEDEEIKGILHVVELYLERLLKPADVQLVVYIYESLGFSADLVMYLFEYCISKNKKNTSYIESVALAWAEQGIDTVEKAEMSTTLYNATYSAVNKAFGLNRTPGNIEVQFMNRWVSTFGFSTEMIVEACNRTLLQLGKPDFKYADRILDKWYNKKAMTMNDLKELDEAHKLSNKTISTTTQSQAPKKQNATSKYNSFPQRNYSKEDFSSMEQRLLNK